MSTTKTPVEYHAPRTYINDSTYGTGRWDHGQDRIKLLDPVLAAKLLKHVDVWKRPEAEEAIEHITDVVEFQVKEKRLAPDDDTLDLRDKVGKMNRDEAIAYAKTHYQLEIPGNTSTANARQLLIQHIDLAGAQ